jgi:hypothetical protein
MARPLLSGNPDIMTIIVFMTGIVSLQMEFT